MTYALNKCKFTKYDSMGARTDFYQRVHNITSLHEVTLPQLWYIIIGTYKLPSDNTVTKEKHYVYGHVQ